METSLIEPRAIVKITVEPKGGWLVDLACGHTVWYAVAVNQPIPCGICAQRLIRQIHELCAKQAPPPFAS